MCSSYKVSVIVPNHGRDISGLIKSVKDSTYKDVELVIIDEGKERSAQRNIGIKKATGEYFLILDSDTEVTPFLIEECVELMKEGHAVYIPEKITTTGFFGKLRNWERQFYTGTCIDVVRFVRPYLWMSIRVKDMEISMNDLKKINTTSGILPAFNETLHGPEDSDWDRRVMGKRLVAKNYLLHHDKIGFRDYCKKKAYYTQSMKRFEERNPGDKILNLRYRCWTVFTENGKWKMLVKSPHYTLALVGLLLIRGVIYWTKR